MASPVPPWRLSVAPMMDHSDRHFRWMMRQLTRHALLHTPMVNTEAILHGDRAACLDFSPEERPLSLQLGSSNAAQLATCTAMAADWGYDEVDLNVGCPSLRAAQRRIGVWLMTEPGLTADCVAAMVAASSLPVTVKCRLGVDDHDSDEALEAFAKAMFAAGATRITIHARKALLGGISAKANRQVPPLEHDRVARLKAAHPDWPIVTNGGVGDLDEALALLDAGVDGVMLGRLALNRPYVMAEVDARIFGDPRPVPSRDELVARVCEYAAGFVARGVPLWRIARHLLNLYAGIPGVKAFKQHLGEHGCRAGAGPEVIAEALTALEARRAHVTLPTRR